MSSKSKSIPTVLVRDFDHDSMNQSTKLITSKGNRSYYYNNTNLYYMVSIVIWFLLCFGVVMKHHNLIIIFYSYISCTCIALICHLLLIKRIVVVQSTNTSNNSNNNNSKVVVHDSDSINIGNNNNNNNNKNTLLLKNNGTTISTMIGILIGMIVCMIQLYSLIRSIINNNNMNSTTSTITTSTKTLALSLVPSYRIAAGFLVFDQWYTFYMLHYWYSNSNSNSSTSHDEQTRSTPNTTSNKANFSKFNSIIDHPYSYQHQHHRAWYLQYIPIITPYKSLLSIIEDTGTLIIMLIMLVHYYEQQQQQQYDNHHDRNYTTAMNRPPIATDSNEISILFILLIIIWPIYKLLRLTYTFVWVYYDHTTCTSTSTSTSLIHQNSTSITDEVHTLIQSATSSCRSHDTDTTIDSTSNQKKMIWRIHNIDYDVSDFVPYHPGGYEAIMLGCNRHLNHSSNNNNNNNNTITNDCTALFHSYHPSKQSYQTAIQILSKYRIDNNNNNNNNNMYTKNLKQELKLRKDNEIEITESEKDATIRDTNITMLHKRDDEFYDLLCTRVTNTLWDQYHFHIVKDRTADMTRIIYYITITIGVIISAYYYIYHGSLIYGSIPLALFGWLFGALGHDGGHFAVCRTYPIMNDICVWAMSLLCNPIVWQHQHTYGHHSYTNDVRHDPDLHHFTTLLRVHEKFQYYNIYQYQKHRWYVLLTYMFVVFGTCIWIPLGIIQEGSLYGIIEWSDRNRPLRTIGMYLHLLLYSFVIGIAPFFVHKHWYTALAAVTIHISLSGIIFAFFSQINHLNEMSLQHEQNDGHSSTVRILKRRSDMNESSFNTDKLNTTLSSSWAVQQIESSNNFCPQSVLWYYLSNGLNLQIEHHLFPGINHCHLHKIQPIIQEICNEYGVQYKCYNSWYEIMTATLDWFEQLSKPPSTVVSDNDKSK